MITDVLHRLANQRQSLARDEARAVMTEVLTGKCSDAQIAALLFTVPATSVCPKNMLALVHTTYAGDSVG